MELSPGSFRTFVVGTSYQLGNLVSSASSTIEATIGQRFPLEPKIEDGKKVARYKYGIVIAIFMGCVYAYVILLTFLGPEYKNRHMGVAHDHDLEEAAGQDAVERVAHAPQNRTGSSDEYHDQIEKA
jgi:MFS transporter, SHS family, lactate transporter